MMLKTNKNELTIMNVNFESPKAYEAALYAISSNMIEGWKPKIEDIKLLKERMIAEHGDLRNI